MNIKIQIVAQHRSIAWLLDTAPLPPYFPGSALINSLTIIRFPMICTIFTVFPFVFQKPLMQRIIKRFNIENIFILDPKSRNDGNESLGGDFDIGHEVG